MQSILVAIVVACLLPASGLAQGSRVAFVGQASYAVDAKAAGIGAGVNLDLGPLTRRLGVRLEGTFDYFLVDDPATYWEINGSLLRDVPWIKHLYAGAGVNYARSRDDCGGFCEVVGVDPSSSDIGINVLGGYKLGGGKAVPFVQARVALGGGEQLYLTGGFRF